MINDVGESLLFSNEILPNTNKKNSFGKFDLDKLKSFD